MRTLSGPDIWPELYRNVLSYGELRKPRGRNVLELRNVMYRTGPYQHFDATPLRKLSLSYVTKEFLWFCTGNRFDLSIVPYAKLWEKCIGEDGGINSNYGQYLFGHGMQSTFFKALNHLVYDHDSRRAHIPIFQSWHQDAALHDDYPCTTGMSFVVNNGILEMNVHMRSQDLFWGAGNDVPICFFLLQLAGAYLSLPVGGIVHTIDNLHLYERHWEKAKINMSQTVPELEPIRTFEAYAATSQFTYDDLQALFNEGTDESDYLQTLRIMAGEGTSNAHYR